MDIWLILIPIISISFFQVYYLLLSFKVRILQERTPITNEREEVSILIPVFNSGSTLDRCLSSILANNLNYLSNIVVVLDRCTDNSEAIANAYQKLFSNEGVPFNVVTLPDGTSGKVAGILYGGKFITSNTVLLLDADILLEETALEELVNFHQQCGEPFSACLIYPLQNEQPTLTNQLICNNRLYRQSVLQAVKNLFGVGNFPGGLQMVDYQSYSRLLVDGFLEDLTATYHVLSQGGTVAILPRVLSYEVERQTIRGLFLQRIRWTLGAIQHLPTQIRAAATRKPIGEKILINSYHVMWEFQHYTIALGVLAVPFYPAHWPVLLLPLLLYTLQILRSAYLGRTHLKFSLSGVLFHCVGFPMIISAALIGSLLMLTKKRSFFFTTASLFRRD